MPMSGPGGRRLRRRALVGLGLGLGLGIGTGLGIGPGLGLGLLLGGGGEARGAAQASAAGPPVPVVAPRRVPLAPSALAASRLPLSRLAPGRSTVRRGGALILLRGRPLGGGRWRGSASLPLLRAEGGDTPVLELRPIASAAGAAPAAGAVPPAGTLIRLLLDTGASTSLVTPALVRRLGLASQALPPGSLDLAGGGMDCSGLAPRRTRLPDLAIGAGGSLRLMGVEALVLPVPALPEGVDGVLGAPSLRQLAIRIDPDAQRLQLGEAALASPPPAAARRVALRWRHGVPLLQLGAADSAVLALADTGAEGLFLAPSLAARLRPLGSPDSLRLVGFCGEQRVSRQRFQGLGGGGATPRSGAGAWLLPPGKSVEGIVTENPIFRQLGVEAIVGQELLRNHHQLWRLEGPSPALLLW